MKRAKIYLYGSNYRLKIGDLYNPVTPVAAAPVAAPPVAATPVYSLWQLLS